MRGHINCDLIQVGNISRFNPQDIEPGNVEQLIDKSLETADFLNQVGMAIELRQNVDVCVENGDGGAEFVSSVCDEAPLCIERRLQATESAIDGAHQRMNIGR